MIQRLIPSIVVMAGSAFTPAFAKFPNPTPKVTEVTVAGSTQSGYQPHYNGEQLKPWILLAIRGTNLFNYNDLCPAVAVNNQRVEECGQFPLAHYFHFRVQEEDLEHKNKWSAWRSCVYADSDGCYMVGWDREPTDHVLNMAFDPDKWASGKRGNEIQLQFWYGLDPTMADSPQHSSMPLVSDWSNLAHVTVFSGTVSTAPPAPHFLLNHATPPPSTHTERSNPALMQPSPANRQPGSVNQVSAMTARAQTTQSTTTGLAARIAEITCEQTELYEQPGGTQLQVAGRPASAMKPQTFITAGFAVQDRSGTRWQPLQLGLATLYVKSDCAAVQ